MPNVTEIWKPLGHTGAVTGLLYLYLYLYHFLLDVRYASTESLSVPAHTASRLPFSRVDLSYDTPAAAFIVANYNYLSATDEFNSCLYDLTVHQTVNPFQPKLILVHTTVTGTCRRAYKTCKNWPLCSYVG